MIDTENTKKHVKPLFLKNRNIVAPPMARFLNPGLESRATKKYFCETIIHDDP